MTDFDPDRAGRFAELDPEVAARWAGLDTGEQVTCPTLRGLETEELRTGSCRMRLPLR